MSGRRSLVMTMATVLTVGLVPAEWRNPDRRLRPSSRRGDECGLRATRIPLRVEQTAASTGGWSGCDR